MEHFSLMNDTEFQMLKTVGDTYEWSWKKVSSDNRKQVLKSLDEGIDQKSISTLRASPNPMCQK